jgi:hypothetical protein
MKSAPKPNKLLTQGVRDAAPWLASCCTFRPMKACETPYTIAIRYEVGDVTQRNCMAKKKAQ